MKIYLVKITICSSPMAWYASQIGGMYYCEESRPYVNEEPHFLVLRSRDNPTYIGDSYLPQKDCRVLDAFHGQMIPTNTVEFLRDDPQ